MASDSVAAFTLAAADKQQLQTGISALLQRQIVLQQSLREQNAQSQAADEALYLELLEVVDVLDTLLETLARHPEPEAALYRRLPKNLASLQRKLTGILAARAVTPIAVSDGGDVDFAVCRVVDRETVAQGERTGIRRIVRTGYRLRDQVLRPAEVIVGVTDGPAVFPTLGP